MNSKILTLIISCFAIIFLGCTKLLNEKSDIKLSFPSTVEDNQALIDQFGFSNTEFASSGETSSDDLYLSDADYKSIYSEETKRLYIWMPDHVSPSSSLGNDWASCFRGIYTSNSILDNLKKYNLNGKDANNVKGQALALRAARYLDAAQIWCLAFNKNTATTDLGLPLRLNSDFNISSQRKNLQETYDQILKDLHESVELLPTQQISKMRVSKTTALSLLARTYLYMGDYDNALVYSMKALNIQNSLMDYNNLNPDDEYPIPDFNQEIIFFAAMKYEYHLIPAKVPKTLYDSYDEDDLRKQLFFVKNDENNILFKGYYNNMNGPSSSVAVDELYLIAAESFVRLNQIKEGLNMLNQLLKTRWKSGKFELLKAENKDEALSLILLERRKELLFRGVRWADIKRLNRDGANINLSRTVNGVKYSLPANDLRFAIAIPEEITEISTIQKNFR